MYGIFVIAARTDQATLHGKPSRCGKITCKSSEGDAIPF